MTQGDLAGRLGVGQSLLSKVELGKADATQIVERMVWEFDLGPAFFARGRPDLHSDESGTLRYRRRSRTKESSRKRATALFAEMYDVINIVAPDVGLTSDRFNALQGPFLDIEAAARATREAIGLTEYDPVPNAIRRCENLGVVVIPLVFGDDEVDLDMVGHDGMSAWEFPLDVPVIGYLPVEAGDRLRHTIFHELGHLLLHQNIRGSVPADRAKAIEAEASRFASAVLLPERPLRAALQGGDVTLKRIAALKAGWGASIGSIVMRCADLGLIDAARKASLWKQISARGWRKREPVRVPLEHPRLFAEMLNRYRSEITAQTGLPAEMVERAAASGRTPEEPRSVEVPDSPKGL